MKAKGLEGGGCETYAVGEFGEDDTRALRERQTLHTGVGDLTHDRGLGQVSAQQTGLLLRELLNTDTQQSKQRVSREQKQSSKQDERQKAGQREREAAVT
jgi:hypothetical protein